MTWKNLLIPFTNGIGANDEDDNEDVEIEGLQMSIRSHVIAKTTVGAYAMVQYSKLDDVKNRQENNLIWLSQKTIREYRSYLAEQLPKLSVAKHE